MKNGSDQLFNLLQSIEGIVWESGDGMQTFSFVSGYMGEVLGFSPSDCLGKPGFWESLIHEDDRSVMDKYRELAVNRGNGCSLEYRVTGAGGRVVWIRDNFSAADAEGQPAILRGVMLDHTVTKRLRMLEELETDVLGLNSNVAVPVDEVLLRYLVGLEELFPPMLCSFHRIRNCRLNGGLSPSLPKAYMTAMVGLEIGENEGSCGAAAVSGRQVIVGNINTHPNWAKYTPLTEQYGLCACWSNPVTDSEGQVMATLAMYYLEPREPSGEELKVMERATALLRIILENRQKTELIWEANLLMLQSQELAHFGNWRWDVPHDVVSWSPALYTIYGLRPESFKATFSGYQELLHPDDRDRVYQVIKNVLHNGGEAAFDERIIRPGGEIRHLRSWAKLKTDLNDNPVEMIGACLDITESVSQQAAIEQRERELEQISEQQTRLVRALLALEESHADNSRMLRVVSHDLRNPVGAISMAASALLAKTTWPEKERRLLEIIRRSAGSSLDLVNDLLHMQGRADELKKEPVELGAMLHHCADLLRHQAEAKKQRINLRIVPVTIAASREKLWRVISNLLANAIKFSPERTVILIGLRAGPDSVVVTVKDEGIGIPLEMQNKMFEMNSETSRTGTAGEPSFGMGLAISRQIVEAHGGRIWLESEVNHGSTFFVQLPVN